MISMVKSSQGAYEFDVSEWDSVSPVAKACVRHLMTVNPTVRLTCSQALDHPWLTAISPFLGSAAPPSRPLPVPVLRDADSSALLETDPHSSDTASGIPISPSDGSLPASNNTPDPNLQAASPSPRSIPSSSSAVPCRSSGAEYYLKWGIVATAPRLSNALHFNHFLSPLSLSFLSWSPSLTFLTTAVLLLLGLAGCYFLFPPFRPEWAPLHDWKQTTSFNCWPARRLVRLRPASSTSAPSF